MESDGESEEMFEVRADDVKIHDSTPMTSSISRPNGMIKIAAEDMSVVSNLSRNLPNHDLSTSERQCRHLAPGQARAHTCASEQQVDDMRDAASLDTEDSYNNNRRHGQRVRHNVQRWSCVASLDTEDSYNNNWRHGQRVRYTCAVKRAAGGRYARMQHRSTQRTVTIITGDGQRVDTHRERAAGLGTDSDHHHVAQVDDMRCTSLERGVTITGGTDSESDTQHGASSRWTICECTSLDTEDSYNNNRRHGQRVRYTHTRASSRWTICEMQHRSTQRTVTIITGGTDSESDTQHASEQQVDDMRNAASLDTEDSYNNNRRHGQRVRYTHTRASSRWTICEMQHRSTQRTVTIITGGTDSESDTHTRERAAGGRYARCSIARHRGQWTICEMQHRSTQRTVTIITDGTDSGPIHTLRDEQQVDDMRDAASLDTEDSYNNNRRGGGGDDMRDGIARRDSYNNNRRHGQRVRYTDTRERAAGGRYADAIARHRDSYNNNRRHGQRVRYTHTGRLMASLDTEDSYNNNGGTDSSPYSTTVDVRDAASLDTEDSYNNNRRHGQRVRYTHTRASSRWTICEMQHRSTQRTVTIITGGTDSESDTHTRERAAASPIHNMRASSRWTICEMQHRSTQRTVTIITGGTDSESDTHTVSEQQVDDMRDAASLDTEDSYNNNRRHGQRVRYTHVSEQQVDDMRDAASLDTEDSYNNNRRHGQRVRYTHTWTICEMHHRSTQRTVTIITDGTDSESDTHTRERAAGGRMRMQHRSTQRTVTIITDGTDSESDTRRSDSRWTICEMQHRSTQRTVTIITGGTDSESDTHARERAAASPIHTHASEQQVDDMRNAASLDTEDSYNNNRRHGQRVRYTCAQASSRWTICEMQHRSTQRTVTIITGGTDSESDTHARSEQQVDDMRDAASLDTEDSYNNNRRHGQRVRYTHTRASSRWTICEMQHRSTQRTVTIITGGTDSESDTHTRKRAAASPIHTHVSEQQVDDMRDAASLDTEDSYNNNRRHGQRVRYTHASEQQVDDMRNAASLDTEDSYNNNRRHGQRVRYTHTRASSRWTICEMQHRSTQRTVTIITDGTDSGVRYTCAVTDSRLELEISWTAPSYRNCPSHRFPPQISPLSPRGALPPAFTYSISPNPSPNTKHHRSFDKENICYTRVSLIFRNVFCYFKALSGNNSGDVSSVGFESWLFNACWKR
ncbi:hypothetical protein J6590_009774 [Homalodisca vitripennis]|nr:hypothetical protein J6590_009774 [Homalodisca vitripennis]